MLSTVKEEIKENIIIEPNSNSKIYNIDSNHYLQFVERISKLNQKIDKIKKKAPSIQFDKIEIKVLEVNYRKDKSQTLNQEVSVPVYKIKLTGEAPIIKDYKFIASLYGIKDLQGKKSAMSNFKTLTDKQIEHISKYLNQDISCEHCRLQRIRNRTFIVENIKNQNMIQVGSTCIQDFFGHGNPHMIARMFAAMENTLASINKNFSNENSFLLEEAMLVAGFLSKKFGYTSKVTSDRFKKCFAGFDEEAEKIVSEINSLTIEEKNDIIGDFKFKLTWVSQSMRNTNNSFKEKIRKMAGDCLSLQALAFIDIPLFCYIPKFYEGQIGVEPLYAKLDQIKKTFTVVNVLELYPLATPISIINVVCTKKYIKSGTFGSFTRYFFENPAGFRFQWDSYSKKDNFEEKGNYQISGIVSNLYKNLNGEYIVVLKKVKVT